MRSATPPRRSFSILVTPSGTKIALGIDDLAQYAKRKREEFQPLLVRLSSGENRILTPVAPPPDQPSRESYQIFHDVLAAAVLEWRNRTRLAAERAAAEARAEEQRRRAEARGAGRDAASKAAPAALWTARGDRGAVVRGAGAVVLRPAAAASSPDDRLGAESPAGRVLRRRRAGEGPAGTGQSRASGGGRGPAGGTVAVSSRRGSSRKRAMRRAPRRSRPKPTSRPKKPRSRRTSTPT